MSFDNLSEMVDSATTSVGNAISVAGSAVSKAASGVADFLSTGPAGALSSIGSAITGALSSLGTVFKALPGVQLPLPNFLHKYATYDYVLGLAVLSNEELNSSSFMNSAGTLQLICKSANADPTNRIRTVFGQFDYFWVFHFRHDSLDFLIQLSLLFITLLSREIRVCQESHCTQADLFA